MPVYDKELENGLLKYILMIKPCRNELTKAERISKELEDAVRALAKEAGINPYYVRNIALAIGLLFLELGMPESVRALIQIASAVQYMDPSLLTAQT